MLNFLKKCKNRLVIGGVSLYQ